MDLLLLCCCFCCIVSSSLCLRKDSSNPLFDFSPKQPTRIQCLSTPTWLHSSLDPLTVLCNNPHFMWVLSSYWRAWPDIPNAVDFPAVFHLFFPAPWHYDVPSHTAVDKEPVSRPAPNRALVQAPSSTKALRQLFSLLLFLSIKIILGSEQFTLTLTECCKCEKYYLICSLM